jgi:hypothetical protein
LRRQAKLFGHEPARRRDGQANGIAFVDMVVLQGVSTDVGGLLNNGSLALD